MWSIYSTLALNGLKSFKNTKPYIEKASQSFGRTFRKSQFYKNFTVVSPT